MHYIPAETILPYTSPAWHYADIIKAMTQIRCPRGATPTRKLWGPDNCLHQCPSLLPIEVGSKDCLKTLLQLQLTIDQESAGVKRAMRNTLSTVKIECTYRRKPNTGRLNSARPQMSFRTVTTTESRSWSQREQRDAERKDKIHKAVVLFKQLDLTMSMPKATAAARVDHDRNRRMAMESRIMVCMQVLNNCCFH